MEVRRGLTFQGVKDNLSNAFVNEGANPAVRR